jgi:hypothetical protein
MGCVDLHRCYRIRSITEITTSQQFRECKLRVFREYLALCENNDPNFHCPDRGEFAEGNFSPDDTSFEANEELFLTPETPEEIREQYDGVRYSKFPRCKESVRIDQLQPGAEKPCQYMIFDGLLVFCKSKKYCDKDKKEKEPFGQYHHSQIFDLDPEQFIVS